MANWRFAAAACCMLSLGAQAQVNRCIDGAGKVTFSDTACSTSTKQADQVMGSDATAKHYDPGAPQRNLDSINRAAALQQATVEGVIQQSQGGVDAGLIGTPPSAAAPRAQAAKDPNPISCDTYSTRRGCVGGSRANNSNWSPNRGYYGGGGSADAAYEQQQERARQAAARAAATATSAGCNASGCWDTAGNRYDRAGGNGFWRSDGKFCTSTGNTFACN